MVPWFYMVSLWMATALGWGSWFLVISKMSPFISGALALGFFYGSLWVALTGTFGLIGYYLRLAFEKSESAFRPFNNALRQGVFLSLMVCVGLVFQRLRVLTWWDMLLLFMIVVLIEYYFMNRR